MRNLLCLVAGLIAASLGSVVARKITGAVLPCWPEDPPPAPPHPKRPRRPQPSTIDGDRAMFPAGSV